MASRIHWITDNETLARHCEAWQELPFVALDTEFMRVDTFYPQAALLQVCAAGEIYLIDPLSVTATKPLAELFTHPSVVKVLHACGEDLEVFQRLIGVLPSPLFDTQLAAAYLNIGFSMGYSRLVQTVLGVELEKGETRSDWLQRPLSELQVRYAADDVSHLAELYQALEQRLSEPKRAWIFEDGQELIANASRQVEPNELYRDAKLAWKLAPQQLAVMRALCAWREVKARERDVPRNRILKENSLWPLARYQPKDLAALGRIDEMQPRTLRQDGQTLLSLIAEAASLPTAQWPQALPEPLPVEASALLKKLRAVGQAQAQRLDIAPEVMLRKKTLEAIIKSGYPTGPYSLPDSFRGWRRELMGEALLKALAGEDV